MECNDRSRYRPHHLVAMVIPILVLPFTLIAAQKSPGQDGAVTIKTNLSDVKSVQLRKTDNRYRFLVRDIGGGELDLTPEEFARTAYQRQSKRTWWRVLLSTSSWQGILWVALGLVGQLMFTGRMLVQWIASEKKKKSVVPPIFWWMSLGGASMLMIYFIWRKDIIGIMGQSTGWIIYMRNLIFIARDRKRNQSAPQTTS